MHAWESIQNVLDYIENNLTQIITIEELSNIASLSPFYFQRLFTRLVKRPVYEYIKMRRLARACEILADKSQRILDIALQCGFNSHEHFTKTFKNAFGITPESYRNNPVWLNQVIKPDLLLNYMIIDEDVPLVADGIVLEISRRKTETSERYIGISTCIEMDDQIPLGETTGIDFGGQLWDNFHRCKNTIKGIDPDGLELGMGMSSSIDHHSFQYFTGVLATPDAVAYDDFIIWELPAAEYIVCTVEAEVFKELVTSALYKSMNYLFDIWLPKHNLSTQPFSVEKYLTKTSNFCKMELWVIPILNSES